jgi:hypothetical protein
MNGMDYQESFITTTNKKSFNKFLKRVRTVGEKYYDHHGAGPRFIGTVKQEAEGAKGKALKAGKKYLYFVGERGLINAALPEIPFRLEIIFAEEIDPLRLFDPGDERTGKIYAALSNELVDVTEFRFREDINTLFADMADGMGEFSNTLAYYIWACIYDKVDEFPQINRDFARILCNLTIIIHLVQKIARAKTSYQIMELEHEMQEESAEMQENIARLVHCFENSGDTNVEQWNSSAELYIGSYHNALNYLNYLKHYPNPQGKKEFDPAYYEEFQRLHNGVFETVEKHKTKAMKNIEYLNIKF